MDAGGAHRCARAAVARCPQLPGLVCDRRRRVHEPQRVVARGDRTAGEGGSGGRGVVQCRGSAARAGHRQLHPHRAERTEDKQGADQGGECEEFRDKSGHKTPAGGGSGHAARLLAPAREPDPTTRPFVLCAPLSSAAPSTIGRAVSPIT